MIRFIQRMREGEDGVALVIAVVLMGVIATLAILMLSVGVHTDQASARGRSWVQSLDVAESGVDQAMNKIQVGGGTYSGTFTGSTPEGTYSVTVSAGSRNTFTITATGSVRPGKTLGATRKLVVTMAPPAMFKNALFSQTSIQTKNNDVITGDIWANQNVIVTNGTSVTGSVTAATGYIQEQSNSSIGGDAWSGGFNPSTNYALDLTTVGGDAKAAVTAPPDPITCGGADQNNYKVNVGTSVGGNLTTWGTKIGSGTVGGTITQHSCTSAPATIAMPVYTYSANNYDASTLHTFGTPTTASATAVADFQTWLSAHGNQLVGTFYINQSGSVSQNTRVDLSGVSITGDATVVTNTPIYMNGSGNNTADAIASLISTYKPPVGSSCDVNHDNSDCAIHVKNNFATNGNVAMLIYSPFGPTALKNNSIVFGAIYADSIEIKNNQSLTYDARVDRVVGFSSPTLEVTKWTEVTP